MGDELDLDAVQAAEAEAAGEGFAFTIGGDHFQLPGVLPIEYVFDIVNVGYRAALDKLLGTDDAAKFWAHKPGRNVIEALDKGIAKHYGFGQPGNSSASGNSSKNGTGRSRPTSSVTTD